ncbi:MAG: VTT domain-containing protein [Gemmatimonadetes bacterium]|nr:VTT domain-containing protein [Gemmatimonadota bacterium]
MEQLTPLFEHHGYLLLFGLGFVEFAGLPVASVPVLLLAGSFSTTGTLSFGGAAVAVAVGGLLGDGMWFVLARARGARIVSLVCGLATNPRACVSNVAARVMQFGPAYILPAKFLPGTGNLIAAASGLGDMRLWSFLVLDLMALTLWAATYLALGRVFASSVEVAVAWAAGMGHALAATFVGLILAAGIWRLIKVRIHRRRHALVMGISATPCGSLPVVCEDQGNPSSVRIVPEIRPPARGSRLG